MRLDSIRIIAFEGGRYFDNWVSSVRRGETDIIAVYLSRLFEYVEILEDRMQELVAAEPAETFAIIDSFHPLPSFEQVLGQALYSKRHYLFDWFDLGRGFFGIQENLSHWPLARLRKRMETARFDVADRDRVEKALIRSVASKDFDRPAELIREIAVRQDREEAEEDARRISRDRQTKVQEVELKMGLTERIFSMVVATLFALLVMYLLIRNEPIVSDQLYVALRITMSLMVAVLGATIPGFLNISYSRKGIAIRSGGALALFVLTYLFSPSLISR